MMRMFVYLVEIGLSTRERKIYLFVVSFNTIMYTPKMNQIFLNIGSLHSFRMTVMEFYLPP